MRFFFRVEYNGACYSGWQSQLDAVSIQSTLEKAFSTVVRKACRVVGAGRTDAGVHARGQGAHIELPENTDVDQCIRSVNSLLPRDIAVYNMVAVDDTFHARYSAIKRLYTYRITLRKRPLSAHQSWYMPYDVDWSRVQQEASSLVGKNDFSAFCSSGHSHNTMDCTVYRAGIDFEEKLIIFTIEANRFLYKMVRSLVGTMIDIGRGKKQYSVGEILNSKDRNRAGETAPACGLVLENVFYPEEEL
ncbi:MAG: tRNA pseudouridine(38-40) synthase TruA [Chitinispirillaceae bacterium]